MHLDRHELTGVEQGKSLFHGAGAVQQVLDPQRDLETWTAEWRRVEYPIDAAAKAIQQAGLPLALSDRLYHGQ